MSFEHAGEKIWQGNLGDHLRRQQGVDHPSFAAAIEQLKEGKADPSAFQALNAYGGNPNPTFALPASLLERCWTTAKEAQGDILECGSGLSTLVMGMAVKGTPHVVWAMEHDLEWLQQLIQRLERYDIRNVVPVYAPLLPREEGGNWYGANLEELPSAFDVVLIDGPPRKVGKRALVFDVLGERIRRARTWLIDDVSDPAEAEMVRKYAGGRKLEPVAGLSGGVMHQMVIASLPPAKREAA
jgi:hypothetical protein